MSVTNRQFQDNLCALGIHALIALDDARKLTGSRDAYLRQEIAERYCQTRDNGGTNLSFREWKQVFREQGLT